MFHVEQSRGGRRLLRTPAAGIVLLAVLLQAAGCAAIRSVRLYAPESSGFERVRPGVYVDPAMTASRREAFAVALEAGRRQAADFYGGLVSSPSVFACASKACTRRFGGVGKGMTRTQGILLSPEGLTPVIVAHEWSHAEFAARVGRLRTWWSVPQWFDEGLAVLVSRDPVYTEDAWRAATENGAKAPALSDLETLRGWFRATGEDGKTKQFSYGTARREVAAWYAAAGPEGFRDMIANLRNGRSFRESYETAAKTRARTGCSTWNIPPRPGGTDRADGSPAQGEARGARPGGGQAAP